MAGIYMRHVLGDEPEIGQIAAALGITVERVIGCFYRVWSWGDQHIRELPHGKTGMPPAYFDRMVGVPGFVAAVVSEAPHWMAVERDRVQIHNLERHNGPSAKIRRDDAKRKAQVRAQGKRDDGAKPGGARRTESPVVYPEWLPLETWVSFLGMCKQYFTAPTKRQQVVLVNTLAGLRAQGQDPQAVLQQSVERRWREVLPVVEENGNGVVKPVGKRGRVARLRVVPVEVA
jgi:hypothetical protein